MKDLVAQIQEGFDVWNIDDKDVILTSSDQIRFANKKDILKCYLEKIGENVTGFKLEEDKKRRLRSLYKSYQNRADLTKDRRMIVENKDLLFDDKQYLDKDADGKEYVSDDI